MGRREGHKRWESALVPVRIKARDIREDDLVVDNPRSPTSDIVRVYAVEYDGKSPEYPVVRTGPGLHDWHSERRVPEHFSEVSGMKSNLCGFRWDADKDLIVYRFDIEDNEA